MGDSETVVEKILRVNESLGRISRLTFQMSVAALPHAKLMRAIELLGTRVAPLVRRALASGTAEALCRGTPIVLYSRRREQLVHHRQKIEPQGRGLLVSHGLSASAHWWKPQNWNRLAKLLPAWNTALPQALPSGAARP